jgi:hypothetical protein
MIWFLYDSNGNIKELQMVNVQQWTNLNGYAGALSFAETNAIAQDAYANPQKYLVQNNQLVLQPYLSLTSALVTGTNYDLTTIVNAQPSGTAYPALADFSIGSTTIPASLTASGTAALSIMLDPSVGTAVNVGVSASGTVGTTVLVGTGTASNVPARAVSGANGYTVIPQNIQDYSAYLFEQIGEVYDMLQAVAAVQQAQLDFTVNTIIPWMTQSTLTPFVPTTATQASIDTLKTDLLAYAVLPFDQVSTSAITTAASTLAKNFASMQQSLEQALTTWYNL